MIVMKEHICTTLEQARELAKFLDSENADMYWQDIGGAVIPTFELIGTPPFPKDSITPCWSLDALLRLLPEVVRKDEVYYSIVFLKECGKWPILYEEAPVGDDLPKYYDNLIEQTSENFLDAAYNVIIELHNKELL